MPMPLKRLLFSFDGRIGRSTWWQYTVSVAILGFVILFIDEIAGTSPALLIITGVVFIYPTLAVHTKRWHDRGKSGWWNLILLVPYVNFFWIIIELGCLSGNIGKNEYGPGSGSCSFSPWGKRILVYLEGAIIYAVASGLYAYFEAKRLPIWALLLGVVTVVSLAEWFASTNGHTSSNNPAEREDD